jgi:hypothetical protein
MLQVVLVTIVVIIVRFTITPTTAVAVVCLDGFYPVVVLYLRNFTVLLVVLVIASMVVPLLELTPHHSY